MRILVFGINYSPELTGIGKYTGEMCSWLAKEGHDVHVITAMPYYPEWKRHSDYRGKIWHKEFIDGVTIHRCPIYIPTNVSSSNRMIHEFSLQLSILPVWSRLLFRKKFDVVVSITPPFHLGLLPLLYKSLRGASLITHVQDLQVDAAKELGMINNGTLLKVMFNLEKFILQKSSIVSTISLGMRRKIEAKGVDGKRLLLFPNWVDDNVIKPLSKEQSLRKEFNLPEDAKVVLYSGNLGEKQGLEIIIDVAKQLSHRKDIRFLIVGAGGGRERLVQLANNAHLLNVDFHPLQPYEKLSALLATADVHLVLQKKSASDLVMPSKLTGILSAGGCAIVSAVHGTSLYEVISDNELGILIDPESVDSLKNGIEKALCEDLQVYKTNARQFSKKYLNKDSILRQFNNELGQLVNAKNRYQPAKIEKPSPVGWKA
jgi:colanic acid biosynthesis glycosyl transferase WcaI